MLWITGANFIYNNPQPYNAGSLNNVSSSYPIQSSTTDSGTNSTYNYNAVSGEGLSQRWDLPVWMGSSDGRNTAIGTDRGFAVPQPTSPNDTQFWSTPENDFGKITQVGAPYNRYNSYWTPTPPRPSEFTPLEQFQQDLWRGTLGTQQPNGYTYNIPQLQYPPTPATAPEPYLNSWQYKMANNVWDIPQQFPTLPPGTSW
jgi:hypothetical protein